MLQSGKRIKSVSYAKYGYIFSIPFILTFLFFSLYPTVFTAVIGFTDFKGVTTQTFKYLADPFANFASILNNATFQNSFKNISKNCARPNRPRSNPSRRQYGLSRIDPENSGI